MKAKDLLLRIIQKKPSLTTFHVAKLAYLFDLASVQLTGEPATDIPYEWQLYGPYTREIDNALWDLVSEKKIIIQPYTTAQKKHECFLHLPIDKKAPRLSAQIDRLLDYVIRRYASMTTENLMKFVYATPPMKEAQKTKTRFQKLDLTIQADAPSDLYERETAEMLLAAEATDRKKYIPLKDVLKKLHGQPA